MRVEPVEVDYYLDTFALTRIEELGTSWKSKLTQRIDANRKTNVEVM